ncbi:MAG: class I SAM-dependent rRNA methyltransferase [Alphaproteobacteria bacterium]
MAERPTVRLLAGHAKRLRAGHPWVFSNEIAMDEPTRRIPPGAIVRLQDAGGEALASATFNPHSLIAARVLDPDAAAPFDGAAIAVRIQAALALRDRLIGSPFYRLIHAESDRLPGLVVDRFGDLAVVQANTAGMERLLPDVIGAIGAVVRPAGIVLRCDSPVRRLEGLEPYVRTEGDVPDRPIPVAEGGVRFLADPVRGQKTGWYFDQRDNRTFVAGLAEGLDVLDAYCHTGGFGLRALAAGAARATLIDGSEPALELARAAAEANRLGDKATLVRADVFTAFEARRAAGETYGLVIADPPSFVKSRKDLGAGLRGYRKLARLAAGLVAPGGFLALFSCSHNVDAPTFADQVRRGLIDAGRQGRILKACAAAADHPVHPALAESAYLKGLVLQVD